VVVGEGKCRRERGWGDCLQCNAQRGFEGKRERWGLGGDGGSIGEEY